MSFPDLANNGTSPSLRRLTGVDGWAISGDFLAFSLWWSSHGTAAWDDLETLDQGLALVIANGSVPYVGPLGSVDPNPQHATIARHLIRAGAWPPSDALSTAAAGNNPAMIDLLVEAGLPLDRLGQAALTAAANNGHTDTVRHLIDHHGQVLHPDGPAHHALHHHLMKRAIQACVLLTSLDRVQGIVNEAHDWGIPLDLTVLLQAVAAAPSCTAENGPDGRGLSLHEALAIRLMAGGAHPCPYLNPVVGPLPSRSGTALFRAAAAGNRELLDLFVHRMTSVEDHIPALMRHAAHHGQVRLLHHLIDAHRGDWSMLDAPSHERLALVLESRLSESVRRDDGPTLDALLQTVRQSGTLVPMKGPLGLAVSRRSPLVAPLVRMAARSDLEATMPAAMGRPNLEVCHRWAALTHHPTVQRDWVDNAILNDQVDNLAWALPFGLEAWLLTNGRELVELARSRASRNATVWLEQQRERLALNAVLADSQAPRGDLGHARRRL